jgi:hypothetical protein
MNIEASFKAVCDFIEIYESDRVGRAGVELFGRSFNVPDSLPRGTGRKFYQIMTDTDPFEMIDQCSKLMKVVTGDELAAYLEQTRGVAWFMMSSDVFSVLSETWADKAGLSNVGMNMHGFGFGVEAGQA